MAGIIKINLKDIGYLEGQSLTVSLQKCLDPYATCLLVVKSVKTNRSRVKKGTLGGDWKLKSSNDQKFESRSEAPIMDIRNIKQRSKYNEGDSFGPKKPNLKYFSFSNEQSAQGEGVVDGWFSGGFNFL